MSGPQPPEVPEPAPAATDPPDPAPPVPARGLRRLWSEIKEVDGLLLFISVMVTMAVTLRLDFTQQVEAQADASIALANASYQALIEISDEFQDQAPDFEDIEGRLRELRYLNYTSDRQIPAGRNCFLRLIEVVDTFAGLQRLNIQRAGGNGADVPFVPIERADGELEPYPTNIEKSLRHLKDRVEIWRHHRARLRFAHRNLTGSGFADRAFDACLVAPEERQP